MPQPTSLKPAKRISKLQLSVFLLVFGLLGSIILILTHAASNPNLAGDLNNDNKVDSSDLAIMIANYGTTFYGADINGDGHVDGSDFSVLLGNYGKTYVLSGFYVDPVNGSDANSGSQALPWKTIQHAMDTLQAGQTAYLRAGTYVEGGMENKVIWSNSGTAGSLITISGYPGEEKQVILKTQVKFNGQYERLTRLVVDKNLGHCSYGSTDCGYTGDVNVWINSSNDTVDNTEIRNSNQSGIFSTGSNTSIMSNYIHDNGHSAYLDHGIYLDAGTNTKIVNNIIEHNFAFGIQLYPDADNNLFAYNTVIKNGVAGIIVSGDTSHTADNNVIVNNISSFNGEEGIRTGSSGLTTSGNVAHNNVVFGNNTTGHGAGNYWFPLAGLSDSGDINQDPLFINLAGGDYHLQSGSPAINTADSQYANPTDFGGKNRDAHPDIGALEF